MTTVALSASSEIVVAVSIHHLVRHAIMDRRGWVTIRQVYGKIAGLIPADRAKAVYRRQTSTIHPPTQTEEHRVKLGRKRAIYRACLQLAGVGYLRFGSGADWDRQVKLTRDGRLLTCAERGGYKHRQVGQVFRVSQSSP